MNHQGRVIRELLPANLTRTLLQPSAVRLLVYSHVQSQSVSSVESYAARVATKLPLVFVDSHVLLQRRAVLEHLVAMRTLNAVGFVGVHVLGQAVERH